MASSLRRLASNSGKVYRSALSPISRTSSTFPVIPSKSLIRSVSCRALCTAAAEETRTQKLERIADEVLSLSKLEHQHYVTLLRHKLCCGQKTIFDVKLEKFDPEAKLMVLKAILDSSDLDVKGAKDLVEGAPAVVKKGVTKEEAEKVMEKLKEAGATVVLE